LGSSGTSPDLPIVFVVDYDVSLRESMELLIRQEGWQPETLACAREFLDRSRPRVPTCLVLDVRCPWDLNGLDLQKRIAVERTETPIIFIAGQGDVPTSVQAMKAGTVEFLIKPFGDEAFVGVIREALKRSSVEHTGGYSSDEATRVARTLLPDILFYDPSRPAVFPHNGRALTDDAIDVFLAILTNGRITSDNVGPHKDLLSEFPFLGAPHEDRSAQRVAACLAVQFTAAHLVVGSRRDCNRYEGIGDTIVQLCGT
jgi:FixJ family two-component response regulator